MGVYSIPRNLKGEGRILYIFSTKALAYTGVGAVIGGIFYFIFEALKLTSIGALFVVLFGFIGFSIATFKIPKIKKIQILKDIGGENIDDVIKRYIKFKCKKKNKYALYKTKEEK